MSSRAFSEGLEAKSDKYDGYDGDVADGVVGVPGEASPNELVVEKGVEEVDSLVEDEHENAEAEVSSGGR